MKRFKKTPHVVARSPDRATVRRPCHNQSVMTRGFTLVELLIVVAIIGILAGTALSQMKPGIEARRMRESARIVSTMLYQARARAVETGRPAGIWLERDRNNPRVCRTIMFAESPGYYSGDSDDARAEIIDVGRARLIGANTNLIKVGDQVRFNFQDPWYEISTPGDTIQFALSNEMRPTKDAQGSLPRPNKGNSQKSFVPFQIARKPRPSSATRPAILPGEVVLDLSQSGWGDNGVECNQQGNRPLIIMFSPTGSVDRVYDGEQKHQQQPISTIHLLVGKNSRAGSENLQDPLNIWVSIGRQTGAVSVSPIYVRGEGGGKMSEARRLARTLQGSGAK